MLKDSDKRVVRAFVSEKPASSNLLDTDGVRLDKIGMGGETVAKWVGGRIAIVSTESAKSDESIIRLIVKEAGPGVVDYSYARKGHRVHEHGAMGRNGVESGMERRRYQSGSGPYTVYFETPDTFYFIKRPTLKAAKTEALIQAQQRGGIVIVTHKGREVWDTSQMEPNGKGIYHETPAGKNDMVIYQGRSSGDGSQPNWRIDLVTSTGGTHTDITGPNRGYSSPSAAFTAALDAQHTRGLHGKTHVYIADRDGNLSDYEPEDAHLPFERNGRKGAGTGRLRPAKRVTVSDLPDRTGDSVLFCPQCQTEYSAYRGDYFQMGPREPFKCASCGHHLQLRKVAAPRPTALDEGLAEDDYVVSVIDRDGGIGLFRVQRGGWRNTEPLTVGYKLDQVSDIAEQDARDRGVQDAVVWDGDEGRQIGHVLHGRWQVDMEPNGRASTVDEHAARELSIYIENEYALIGAPNSIGKSIDTNLRKKVASGKYDPAQAPKAWQYLIDAGAKKYAKEYSVGDDHGAIFSAATRRQVAEEFARAWELENQVSVR